MIILHTRNFCVLSRAMLIALGEKRATFHNILAPQFEISPELQNLDEIGRTPILIDDMYGNGAIIKEAMAAFEYIEDIIPFPALFPGGPLERAEVRGFVLNSMREFKPFLHKLLGEKVFKVIYKAGPPLSNIIREIREEAAQFIEKSTQITIKSGHVIGNKFSLADFILGAQISILDYLDLIAWEKHIDAKNYYLSLKQRPSFAPILNDVIIGINPPSHYKELDF